MRAAISPRPSPTPSLAADREASSDFASPSGGARVAEGFRPAPAAAGAGAGVAPPPPAAGGAGGGDAGRGGSESGGVSKLGTAFRTDVPAYPTWDAMDLPEDLFRGINSYGFDEPTPIQARAIVPMMKGLDVVAQAQTGSGKTGAFCTGLLARIDLSVNEVQGASVASRRRR